MIDPVAVSAMAGGLRMSWETVSTIAMYAAQMTVSADMTCMDGLRVIGVDEHRWSHTRRPGEGGYLTVITKLTPVLGGGARLLAPVPVRSAAVFTTGFADLRPCFAAR